MCLQVIWLLLYPKILYLVLISIAGNCLLQSNIGAKNHAIIMPDACMGATLDALVAAGFGAAGQRCTALSTVVFVGGSKSWYSPMSFSSVLMHVVIRYAYLFTFFTKYMTSITIL